MEAELLQFFQPLFLTVFFSCLLGKDSLGPSWRTKTAISEGLTRGYMSENQTNEPSKRNQDCVDGNMGNKDLATNSTSNSLSRRSFLGRAGTSTAVAAASVGLPSLLLTENLAARGPAHMNDHDDDEDDSSRRTRSFRIRSKAAIDERETPTPQQVSNHDETRYPNFIGNYSQGLPHNAIGEVELPAYRALLTAVKSGDPEDFALIPLGGNTKLAGPQGGIAFDLEGADSAKLTIPPSPALASAERAGEMVEDYWMALARDIPFSQYGIEQVTTNAITDLNKLSDFRGPKVSGKVTPATLFRGSTPGDLIGPYISQFFLLPISMGTLSITQKFNTYPADTDYLTDFASWLQVQNGQGPFAANPISGITLSQEWSRPWSLGARGLCLPGLPICNTVAARQQSDLESRESLPDNSKSGWRSNVRATTHPRSAGRSVEPRSQGHVVSEMVRAPRAAPDRIRRPCPQHHHGSGKIPCSQ